MADDLVARLRARAGDPERRVDARASTFAAGLGALDLGALAGQLQALQGDLGRLLEATRAGRVDPALNARAERLAHDMARRTFADLPTPATPAAVAGAETSLGFALPPLLRRVYLEVADGGFGPGYGLLPLQKVVATYGDLRRESPGPDGTEWPEKLLPLVDEDGGFQCADAVSGRVIAYDGEALLEEWDPDAPDDDAARRGWKRCFAALAPSLDAWFEAWLHAPTAAERTARAMATARATALRDARARVAAMTPEQRKARGLPETGWEKFFGDDPGTEEPPAR